MFLILSEKRNSFALGRFASFSLFSLSFSLVSSGRLQVVVTQKPCTFEGDYRTWEVLAAGAVLVVDAPARGFGGGFGTLRHSSAPGGPTGSSGGGGFSGGADGAQAAAASGALGHGEHAVFFDPTRRASFEAAVTSLLDAPPLRRYRLAKRGHRLALSRHRAVGRVDALLSAVAEAWALWPQGELAELDRQRQRSRG